MKKGLILEGGAMRGMFTAGVIDVMMELEKCKFCIVLSRPVLSKNLDKIKNI